MKGIYLKRRTVRNVAKVLVTGGAGFIGSHIVDRLLELGHRVLVVDNLSSGGRLENLSGVMKDIEFYPDDIRGLNRMRVLCRGVEYVIHEAAINRVQRSIDNPVQANETNVNGTLNMLIAARDCGVSKVIYASSSSVYGDTIVSPKTETLPTSPKSPYAVSKLAAEHYCTAFTEVYGLPTVALRYFSAFGKRQRADVQYAAVIPKFVDALRKGEPLTIYGDGEQTRDFTCVRDTAEATVMFISNKATGVFNVGKGESSSINQLVKFLEELTGIKAKCTHLDIPKGDWRDSLADIAKIRREGYAPKYSLQSGLEWMLEA